MTRHREPERGGEDRGRGDAHPEPGIPRGTMQASRRGQAEDRHARLVRVVVKYARHLIRWQVRGAVAQEQYRRTRHYLQRAVACQCRLLAKGYLPGKRGG